MMVLTLILAKAWKEMIHRYLAGFLGIFIFAISYIFYKNNTSKLFKLSIVLSLLVIMQATLGMLDCNFAASASNSFNTSSWWA